MFSSEGRDDSTHLVQTDSLLKRSMGMIDYKISCHLYSIESFTAQTLQQARLHGNIKLGVTSRHGVGEFKFVGSLMTLQRVK